MKTASLLYGSTALGSPGFSGDLLWRTGFRVPDPLFLIEIGKETILFASPLESGRAQKEAGVRKVIQTSNGLHDTARFLKSRRIREIVVPHGFPYEIAKALEKEFRIVSVKPPFYTERMRKTEKEIEKISKVQRAAEESLGQAIRFLRDCRVKGKLIYDGRRRVTAESVRKIIDDFLWQRGCFATGTIVAGGVQAADPHAIGAGPLLARAPIVIDIFPVSLRTHYYADMTRTVFKGEPSREYIRVYETVRQAQEQAIAEIRAGADGQKIYDGVCRYFEKQGYPTRIGRNQSEGFIHGLGHGVGIDLHEPPSIGTKSSILESGNVITIEPGLYYRRARSIEHGAIPPGGTRIEDMVLVKKNGCRNLTKFPKDLKSIVI